MKGDVVIISGLSGSGKSTLAEGLREFLANRGRNIVIHDGDTLRTFFDGALLYSSEDRLMVSKVLVYAASVLSEQGVDVILATMLSQKGAREFLAERLDFVEVHLEADLEDVADKDVKGVYKESFAREVPNVVGHDLDFHAPKEPDLTVRTHVEPPEESLKKILHFFEEKGVFGLNGDPR